jgi:glycosyltransferase involved in cell wall biosynthesis
MKILFHSNAPWMKTGYGQQTAVWTTRLRDLGHDVAIHGYAGAQHLTVEWEGMTVYPAGAANAIGMDVLGYFFERHQADVVISLCDAWALSPKLMKLMPTVCWTPVDAEPLSQGLKDFFEETKARPLAMSKYGQRLFAEGGVPASYIPHGLSMDLFKPPEDREALRKASGFGPETFVVGMNQANRSGLRKALPEQIGAFARFHERHPDSRLLLNMAMDHPKGQDLPLLLRKLGAPEGAAFFPDQGAYGAGDIATESMPLWYGALDVLMGCAMAGGFELPLLEAQACGTPVIATHGSAMTEVAGPHSWQVPGQDFWVEERHEGFWTMPLIGHTCSACGHMDGIEAALEQAWQERQTGEIEVRRKLSREHALQYDADLILRDSWMPFLAELEAAL